MIKTEVNLNLNLQNKWPEEKWLDEGALLHKDRRNMLLSIVAYSLWHIWNVRNQKIFRGGNKSPACIFHSAIADTINMTNSSSEGGGNIKKKWEAPKDLCCFKINIDGAFHHSNEDGGSAYVICDNQGRCPRMEGIYAAKTSVLQTEVITILIALQAAKEDNLTNEHIESDAKIIANAINAEGLIPWKITGLIKYIIWNVR